MAFKDKFRKAFGRSSSEKIKDNGCKSKIEYYRRGECPRSKYRGPVDPAHRRKLYEWNFAAATAERRRSFDLDLSPCTSLPDTPGAGSEVEDEVAESDPEIEQAVPAPVLCGGTIWLVQPGGNRRELTLPRAGITVSHHEVAPSGSVDTDTSTAVGSTLGSSYGSSVTLKESWDWPVARRDAMTALKDSLTYTVPVTRRISAPEKRCPFPLEDLSRALNAVQIVS
jgi:hypothetical protein